MAEDTLVQMLLEVAGGQVADERDITLARAAARWAMETAGWQLHPHNGFLFERAGMCFWVLANRPDQALEIRVSADPRSRWRLHVRHRIAHLGHGLDVLAAEDLLPGRFSTLGRKALDDYAEALQRTVAALRRTQAREEFAGQYSAAVLTGERIAALQAAIEQARSFPRSELAVTS